jgi:hypothetical protein
MSIADTIRQRAANFAPFASLAPFVTTIDRALSVHETAIAARDAVAKNGNLTALGRVAEMRSHTATQAAPHLFQCQKAIELLTAKTAALRASLGPPAPDAATAALRAEARGMLRSLQTVAERAALLTGEKVPELMRDAALETPAVMSGITEQIRSEIIDVYIEKHNAVALRRVEQTEEALRLTVAAVETASATLRASGEFPTDAALGEFIGTSMGKEKAAAITTGVGQEFAGALQT